MSDYFSFTKAEHQVVPHFRDQLNHAESVEDVRKFFVYAAQRLIGDVNEIDFGLDYDDISLSPTSDPKYRFSSQLQDDQRFKQLRDRSDLDAILSRFASAASHRLQHLTASPHKSRQKIKHH